MRTAPHPTWRRRRGNQAYALRLVTVRVHPVRQMHVRHQLRHEHQRGETDHAVDDVRRRPGPEDVPKEVRVEQGHRGPEEAAEKGEEEAEGLQALHEGQRGSFRMTRLRLCTSTRGTPVPSGRNTCN